MTRRTVLAVTICLLLSSPTVADWSVADMNRQIDQTNFLVNHRCSGTLIDKNRGYVLTASHCIATQYDTITREKIDDEGVVTKEQVRIAKPGTVSQIAFDGPNEIRRTSYVFHIKTSNAAVDLALLQVKGRLPNTIASPLACVSPARGDIAYVVGNPYSVLYSSVTKGIVSSLQRNYPMLGIDGNDGLMQISSGVVGGNSGGAVYDADGNLIGVPVRGAAVHEVIGLAVPLDVIKAFLKDAGLADIYAHCDAL